jgi:beta-galactosidase
MEPGSYRFRWDKVVYAPGEVRVVAYRNGRRWAKDSVRTAGKGAKMEIAEVPQEIRSDGQQFIYIDVSIVDADGNFVPDARQRVSFFPEGPLEVVAVCNGDATSFEPFKANSILSFNGRAQAIIRAKKGAEGRATLMVRSVGLTENPVEFRIRR